MPRLARCAKHMDVARREASEKLCETGTMIISRTLGQEEQHSDNTLQSYCRRGAWSTFEDDELLTSHWGA